jgi:hypothetical protein
MCNITAPSPLQLQCASFSTTDIKLYHIICTLRSEENMPRCYNQIPNYDHVFINMYSIMISGNKYVPTQWLQRCDIRMPFHKLESILQRWIKNFLSFVGPLLPTHGSSRRGLLLHLTTHPPIPTATPPQTCKHTYMNTHMHMNTHKHIYTYKHMHTPTPKFVYVHTYMNTHIRTHTHTHTW